MCILNFKTSKKDRFAALPVTAFYHLSHRKRFKKRQAVETACLDYFIIINSWDRETTFPQHENKLNSKIPYITSLIFTDLSKPIDLYPNH
jgi:hypothetical protein